MLIRLLSFVKQELVALILAGHDTTALTLS
jgi:cytochrome P450